MSSIVSAMLRSNALLWSVGTVCFLLSAWLFFPGSMSGDSWAQYLQALGLMPLANWHPPMLVRLWQLCNMVYRGPEVLFLLFIGVYWLGLTWTMVSTTRQRGLALLLIPLIGFFPPYFVCMSSVWKDAGTLAFLALAFAACSSLLTCEHERRGYSASAIVAVLSLAMAIGLRHNAFTAAIPLVAYLSVLSFKNNGGRMLSFIAISLLLNFTTSWINSIGVQKDYRLSNVVLFWNLCGISVEEERIVIPREAFRNSEHYDLDSIGHYYLSRECDGILHQARMYDPLIAENGERAKEFQQLAFDTIYANLDSYLKIRYEYTMALIWSSENWPPSAYQFVSDSAPKTEEYQDVSVNRTRHPRVLMHYERGLAIFVKARFFSGLPYIIGSAVILLLSIRFYWTSKRNYWLLVAALTFSGMAYWIPYIVIGPSDHFRYLSWTVYASVLAAYLLFNGWTLRNPRVS
jgi:hypothetical protein